MKLQLQDLKKKNKDPEMENKRRRDLAREMGF